MEKPLDVATAVRPAPLVARTWVTYMTPGTMSTPCTCTSVVVPTALHAQSTPSTSPLTAGHRLHSNRTTSLSASVALQDA